MLGNNPSIKLLLKLGFIQDGIITMPETKEELNFFYYKAVYIKILLSKSTGILLLRDLISFIL